jgi:multisubunit Na+/H+ antiporter MnhC subunit
MATTVFLINFSDYTPNEEPTREEYRKTRENVGWIIIALTVIYIAVNMFFILQGIFKGLKLKLKPHYDRLHAKYMATKARPDVYK